MQKKFFILFLSVIFCFAFMCGRQDDSSYTIEIIDGVKHVHNHAPLWGDTLKVALEFVQQIGEFESKDENYLLFVPSDISRDSIGNIYITDASNYRIQKFDSSGKYLATFGRKGQGPSEFSSQPYYLDLNSEGEIYVTSNDLTQWYILAPDGKEKKRFNLPEWGFRFRVSNSGNIIISYYNRPISYIERSKRPIMQVTTYDSLIGVFDNEGNKIKEFGKPIDFGDDEVSRIANRNYIEIDPDDTIYLTFQYKNLIQKYSPEGKLLVNVDYPVEYKKSYNWNIIKRKSGNIIWEMHLPDFPSFSRNIGVDHKKRIWIIALKEEKDEQNLPSYSTEFYIFDNEGILLGKLPVPEIDGWMRIFQDRLYIIDSFESMCVYEYKIVEK